MHNTPVTIEVLSGAQVQLTPELMANAFWQMDTEQQADFFHALAKQIQTQSPEAYGFGEMQWCALQTELRKPGRELANQMHMALSAFAFDFWPQKVDGARTGLY
jgi:hypothetical protein